MENPHDENVNANKPEAIKEIRFEIFIIDILQNDNCWIIEKGNPRKISCTRKNSMEFHSPEKYR